MEDIFVCTTSRPEFYWCKSCKFKTHCRTSLMKHSASCPPGTNFVNRIQQLECPFCNMKTFSKLIFLAHQCLEKPTFYYTKVIEDEWIKCPFCPLKTRYETNLDMHLTVRHSDKLFNCLNCNFRAVYLKELKPHVLTHHRDTEWFKCPNCPLKARYEKDLNNHIKIRHVKNFGQFLCKVCPNRSNNRTELEFHVKEKHFSLCMKCEHCSFKTMRQEILKEHVLNKHREIRANKHNHEKYVQCRLCNYRSLAVSSLRKHQFWRHSPVGVNKMHYCRICEYRVQSRDDLKTHMKMTHIKGNKMMCDMCEFCGTSVNSVRLHKKWRHS